MSMLSILILIAPIFLLIVLGYLLRRGGIPDVNFWNLNDRLVYWVLMPSLLFHKTSTIDMSFELVGSYAIVILGGFFAALVFGLVTAWTTGMENPSASSVMQGAARHNSFLALSVAGLVFGPDGLAIAALATSLLIPVTNFTVVPLMVVLNQKERTVGVGRAILRDLVRNPLILSVCGGIAFNLLGWKSVPVLHEMVGMLGQAALPVVLMCVGANLRPRDMQASALPLALSITGKMAVFPLVTLGLSLMMGLGPLEMSVAMVFAAVPTATAAFTLARQMGGDAPLMAAITTIQTGLGLISIPVWLVIVGQIQN